MIYIYIYVHIQIHYVRSVIFYWKQ